MWDTATWADGLWSGSLWSGSTPSVGTSLWSEGTWSAESWSPSSGFGDSPQVPPTSNSFWRGGMWRLGVWDPSTGWTETPVESTVFWKPGTWQDGVWQDGAWVEGTPTTGTSIVLNVAENLNSLVDSNLTRQGLAYALTESVALADVMRGNRPFSARIDEQLIISNFSSSTGLQHFDLRIDEQLNIALSVSGVTSSPGRLVVSGRLEVKDSQARLILKSLRNE